MSKGHFTKLTLKQKDCCSVAKKIIPDHMNEANKSISAGT